MVEIDRIAVPLFTTDDGLKEQVLSLGLPEHDKEIVPAKSPSAVIARDNEPDEPGTTVKLEGELPVSMVKSGALIVSTRFVDTAASQSLSPEYCSFNVWVPAERGVEDAFTLKLTFIGVFPERGDVAISVLPS